MNGQRVGTPHLDREKTVNWGRIEMDRELTRRERKRLQKWFEEKRLRRERKKQHAASKANRKKRSKKRSHWTRVLEEEAYRD